MGLDACVYCDCVEKGNLRTPPPYAGLVFVEEDGCPELHSDNIEYSIEFDQWRYRNPCVHNDLCLLHHRLGNMSAISRIRWVVQQITPEPETAFPLLWSRVIYNGTHAGDFLTPEEAITLGEEIQRLLASDLKTHTAEHKNFFNAFLQMLAELVEASRLVNKPISF